MPTKRPRLLVFLTGIALFVTAAMYAQADPSTPGDMPGNAARGARPTPPSPVMELDHLSRVMQTASLPLSDAQKVAILGVLEDQDTAMKALAPGGDRAAMDAQMRALRQSSHASIRAVLSEAQAKIFDAMKPPSAPGHVRDGEGAPQVPAAPGGSASVDESTLIDANTGGAASSEAH